MDSFQIWQVYAVALGNFFEYAAVTFQPIREVTWPKLSFFDGEACPDDNLKGILSIHLKLDKYIHSIKIWKSLDFGIDWLRNGRVIND